MNDNGLKKNAILDEPDEGRRDLFARLRAYFLAGIFVTAPIGLTIYLTWIFLQFVNDKVSALIPEEYDPFDAMILPGMEIIRPLISLVILGIAFIMIGWFARNFLGRMIYELAEYILERMPVIRGIHATIKQIFETIMASQSQAFKDVVMFEYPRPGIWTLGFVTGVAKGEIKQLQDDELVSVFLPTAPSPTNGFLLFLPRKSLVPLSMTVEEGVKMVVSCGIITPPEPESK